MTSNSIKLTKTQDEVMSYLGRSWTAYLAHGTVVEINGKKACTTKTMDALETLGLVKKTMHGQYSASWEGTPAGRAYVEARPGQ
jgi:hypothetical protein